MGLTGGTAAPAPAAGLRLSGGGHSTGHTWAVPLSFVSKNSAGGQPNPGSSAMSLSVPPPATISNGNFLIQMVGLDGNTNAYSGLACSGWTLVDSLYDATNKSGGGVLTKVAASESGNYTTTATGLNLWIGDHILQYAGASAVDAHSIATNEVGSTTATTNSLTATGNGEILICTFMIWTNTITGGPAGMTQRSADVFTSVNINTYDLAVNAGATGTKSVTISASSRWAAISVLLK